ncbi:unnamed protein product [Pipistrellus nathusii]|uniref:Uncharacterized protein n=1 Tax=Pipistrellus nathusii TaxID=59473 RepID=A0ABN9ZP05_PIPNA
MCDMGSSPPDSPLAAPKVLISRNFYDFCQMSEFPEGPETSFLQLCLEPNKNTKGKLARDLQGVVRSGCLHAGADLVAGSSRRQLSSLNTPTHVLHWSQGSWFQDWEVCALCHGDKWIFSTNRH